MRKKVTKYTATLSFKNGTRLLNLEKVAEINLSSGKEFFYLESRGDGTWMLNYTKSMIPKLEDFLGITLSQEPINPT